MVSLLRMVVLLLFAAAGAQLGIVIAGHARSFTSDEQTAIQVTTQAEQEPVAIDVPNVRSWDEIRHQVQQSSEPSKLPRLLTADQQSAATDPISRPVRDVQPATYLASDPESKLNNPAPPEACLYQSVPVGPLTNSPLANCPLANCPSANGDSAPPTTTTPGCTAGVGTDPRCDQFTADNSNFPAPCTTCPIPPQTCKTEGPADQHEKTRAPQACAVDFHGTDCSPTTATYVHRTDCQFLNVPDPSDIGKAEGPDDRTQNTLSAPAEEPDCQSAERPTYLQAAAPISASADESKAEAIKSWVVHHPGSNAPLATFRVQELGPSTQNLPTCRLHQDPETGATTLETSGVSLGHIATLVREQIGQEVWCGNHQETTVTGRFRGKNLADTLAKAVRMSGLEIATEGGRILIGTASETGLLNPFQYVSQPENCQGETKSDVQCDENHSWETWQQVVESSERLISQDQVYEAAVALARGTEQFPDQPQLYSALGRLYSQHGESKSAIEALTRSVELGDDEAHTHYLLGQNYRKQGQTELAVEFFHMAHQRNPNYPRQP